MTPQDIRDSKAALVAAPDNMEDLLNHPLVKATEAGAVVAVMAMNATLEVVAQRMGTEDPWPGHCRELAQAEGWDLFETDGCESEPWRNEVLLINRINEMGVFASDEDAFLYVVERAKAGSEMHKRALELHMTLRPED